MSALKDGFNGILIYVAGSNDPLRNYRDNRNIDLTNPIAVTVSKTPTGSWPTALYVWYDNGAVTLSKTITDDPNFNIGSYDPVKQNALITFVNDVNSFGITISRKQGQTDPNTTITIGDEQPGGY